jgi:hypothetical protein
MRRGYICGAVMPLLVFLFLHVEPATSRGEDYLPSHPSRSVTIKVSKSLKSVHNGKASDLNRDLALDGYSLVNAACQTFVLIEPLRQRLHFCFLTNRHGRSPPLASL